MWLAVDRDGEESLFQEEPIRYADAWVSKDDVDNYSYVIAPKGTIEKLLDYPLTWDDEAEELV